RGRSIRGRSNRGGPVGLPAGGSKRLALGRSRVNGRSHGVAVGPSALRGERAPSASSQLGRALRGRTGRGGGLRGRGEGRGVRAVGDSAADAGAGDSASEEAPGQLPGPNRSDRPARSRSNLASSSEMLGSSVPDSVPDSAPGPELPAVLHAGDPSGDPAEGS